MADEAKGFLAPILADASVVENWARPVEGMTPAELMARASVRGIQQVFAIIDQPLDFADVKQQRLVGDMSKVMLEEFRKTARGERHDDVLRRLAELIAAEGGED